MNFDIVSHEKEEEEIRNAFSEKDKIINKLRNQLEVARKLVIALDGAFISSWQSTTSWSKELEKVKSELLEG